MKKEVRSLGMGLLRENKPVNVRAGKTGRRDSVPALREEDSEGLDDTSVLLWVLHSVNVLI